MIVSIFITLKDKPLRERNRFLKDLKNKFKKFGICEENPERIGIISIQSYLFNKNFRF